MAKDKKPDKVQVTNNSAKLRTFGAIQLVPGVSAIATGAAEEIKKHPHFKKLEAAGLMAISDAPPETSDKSVEEAKKLVDKTHNPELLDEYDAKESRGAVKTAIREKQAELAKRPTVDDKD